MTRFVGRRRLVRGAAELLRRYFDHGVARDSAALTYYLLFALFPLLIFLNNLVAVLPYDMKGLLRELSTVVPAEVVGFVEDYLLYLSATSSRKLLWFSLVFSVYFPFRSAGALFASVRKAFGLGQPRSLLRYQLRVLIYTLLLIVALVAGVAVSVVNRRALSFASEYIYLSEGFIHMWGSLRFVLLAVLLFAAVTALYALAQEGPHPARDSWPGVAAALATWMVMSMLFSFYVERVAQYSLIYGSIGTIIVLLLWLYLSATMLIMGAEFNAVLRLGRRGEEDSL